MGVGMFGSSSSNSIPCSTCGINPSPTNFNIEGQHDCGAASVLIVTYPNCTNYKGRKVMVFDIPLQKLISKISRAKQLDPHFSEDSLSPCARFSPTTDGINQAIQFANSLNKS